jgi:hypothetical protein
VLEEANRQGSGEKEPTKPPEHQHRR